MSCRDRVSSPGPKKPLALDGGGIRGVITLEVLRRLESLLAKHLGAGDDFVSPIISTTSVKPAPGR